MILLKRFNIRKTKSIFSMFLVFALIVSLITGSTSTVNAASSALSAYTVDGMTPLGTTVNLFDYYNYVDSNNVIAGTNTTKDGQTSSYYLSDYNNNSSTSYINSGHQLVFGVGSGPGSLNSWTGNANVRSGMVANMLSDGYPALTDNNSITVDDNNTKLTSESLAYLFDDSEVSGKISYNNVDGLFQINDDGYYYYDSQSNYAEYDEDTNSFVLYNTWGVTHAGVSPDGQFFPFTAASDVFTVSNGKLNQNGIASRDAKINHYLGLSMSTRFVQENEGHVDSSDDAKEMTYEFKGDDDVWIYIDGLLIGDLGGIHDAASVSINFATGVVVINEGTSYESTTSLYNLYVAAGLEDTTAWQKVNVNGQTYTIFDDDTYHELDFFYLERGNTDSNLYLMFNLITVPENQIIKIDENGNAVEGAEFALYVANATTDSQGNVTLYKASEDPLWTGTTDSNGELILIDSQNKLINFTTLFEDESYEYYILEETSAPSGYRTTEPMWLHYVAASAGSVTAGLLESLNHFETGSYAQAKLHVTAPGYQDNSGNGLLDYNGDSISNAYDSSGNLNGDIFAVVLKRAGNNDTWYPVSGNVTNGFTLGDAVTISSGVTDDMIVAAHQFTMGANGLYQLELDDLPGKIDSYYYIISAQGGDVEEAQYTVAYYYIDNNNNNATLLQESQFERDYATTFYVADIQNELIVQKVDQNGNPVNGAEFTLYNASEVKVNTDGTYTLVSGASAVATLTTSTLTEADDGIDLEGGGIFSYLSNGSYYVIETKAPEGYTINSEIIKVYVDNSGVYANAGEVDDDVDVILGVNSLVKTMSQFATNDDIDQTLAYILAQLSLNNSTGWITSDDIPSSFSNSGDTIALNYSATGNEEYIATDSEASYPFVVDSGWSSINITQDTDVLENLDVNYTEIENSLNHLYSINTILRVTDNKVTDLAITKSVDVKEGLESILSSLQDIEFTFNVQLLDSDGNTLDGKYVVEIYDENDNLVSDSTTLTNGSGTITLKDGQTAIIKDVITGSTYIVQEEEANKNYDTSITVDYDSDASIGVVEDETLKELITPDTVVGYTGTVIGVVDDVDNSETEDTEIITVNYTNVYDAISKEVDITFDSDGSTSDNASGTTVGVGDVLTYNIEWNNYKKETADVTVKDIIPNGTTYVYGSATNTENLKFYNNNDEEITVTQDNVSSVSYLVWTFNNVEAGASGTVSFDVVVNDTAVENQDNEISNLAEIIVDHDPVVTNTVTNPVPEKTVTDADNNDIDGNYPYVVEKTSSSDTGYRLNYTIYYTNTESDTATVTITDELSEYVTYISGSSYGQNGKIDEPTGTTTLTWTIEDVEAGASGYVTFRVAVNANVVSTIENSGSIKIADNPSVSTNTVTNTVPEPVKDVKDESGTSIDGEKVAVGDELTYTIDYTNTSDETATVVITDAAPTGTTYVDNSAKVYVEGTEVTTDGAVKVADGTITWTVSLEAGESVHAVFKVTVNEGTEGTSIDNDATVVANDYEIKTNTVTNDVPEDPVKDVKNESGTSINGEKVAVGDELTYTIDYTNTSDDTETVVIKDTVPTGTTYVDNSASATVTDVNGDEVNKTVTIDDTGATITWTVSLEAGESVQAVFNVEVTADAKGTSIVNDATVVANDYEIKTNTVTNDVPGDPIKDVTDESGTSINGEKVAVGDELTYTIDYTNTSDETEIVVITDAAPTGTTYVDNSAKVYVEGTEVTTDGAVKVADGTITWTVSLEAGESVQAVFKVKVDESAINMTIKNQASLKIDEKYTIDTNTTNNPEETLIDISGTKNWIDNDNEDELRPESITVGLYKVVGEEEVYVKSTTTDSPYNYSFEDLQKYNDSNEEIKYVVRELDSDNSSVKDGETIEYDGTTYIVEYDDNSFDITNTLTKNITVVKDWNIDEEATINAPDSINVKLTNSVDETEVTAQLSKDTNPQYTYTFENLPVYNDDGSLIEYTINEYDSKQSYNDGALYTVTLNDNSTAVFLVRYDSQDDGIDTYVTITNTYPVYTLEFSGEKTLDDSKPGENDYSFVVKEGEDTITTGYSDEDGNISFAINYTVADKGKHIYTITEVTGDDKSINYDITEKTIIVNVTYENGVLSAEITSGKDDITFKNTSKTTTADIEAQKVLENKDLTNEQFSFTLKDSAGHEIETVSNNKDGSIKFTKLENLKVGEYNYTITENVPNDAENNTLNGIQYDSSIWNVKVVVSVDEATNALVSKVTYAKGNEEYSDSIATFTNKYSTSPITDTITATKSLNGKELAEGEFTFKITGSEGAPLPEGYDSTGVTNDANGNITFGKITFETKGTYVYEVTEMKADQTGYTYDEKTYKVTYVVEDDGNGSLGITSKTITLNDNKVDSIAFENSYQPLKVSTDTTIGGTKDVNIIDGTFELTADQFTFVLTNIDTGDIVQSVQNDANGDYSFDALTFTKAGKFTYKVTETSSNITGISDDSNYYTIIFSVEDQDGQLVITDTTIKDADENQVDSLVSLNFTNTYNPTEITYSISGIKVISNTDSATDRKVDEGEFTFELAAEGETPLPKNTIVTNDAKGNISFDEITFTQTGTYTYLVKEVKGNDSTITYDETVYTIVITITDVDGNLSASANIANEDIIFTNSYTPTDIVVGPGGKVHISGSKNYTDRDGNALNITDGQFSFELIDSNGETISTAQTNSDGTFIFDDITYDKVGTYRYTVKEVSSTLYDGITYDTTVYDVIVHVSEDSEAHALVATVTYMLDGEKVESMSFVNSYSTTPATIHLVGTKVYTGATLTDGQFTYQLLDSDNNVIVTATNDVDGNIDFGTLTYDAIGNYTYTISEVNDEQENVTYDDSIYKVEVVVSDNGLGELVAHISYSVDNEEKATVIFENTYTKVPEEPTTPSETPEEPTNPTETPTDTPTTSTSIEETPKTTTSQTTDVQTGDDSNYQLWTCMMGLAIIGLGYIGYKKKRNQA